MIQIKRLKKRNRKLIDGRSDGGKKWNMWCPLPAWWLLGSKPFSMQYVFLWFNDPPRLCQYPLMSWKKVYPIFSTVSFPCLYMAWLDLAMFVLFCFLQQTLHKSINEHMPRLEDNSFDNETAGKWYHLSRDLDYLFWESEGNGLNIDSKVRRIGLSRWENIIKLTR